MSNLGNKFEKYLFTNLGIPASIAAWPKEKSLPPFLRDLYSFHECRLLDRPCLVMAARDDEETTPATIRKHMRQIAEIWQHEVIYLHPSISSYNRKRLIEYKISFVVPCNQMYLPFLGIDFRERLKTVRLAKKKFSPSTQAVILFVLYNWPQNGVTPSQLAGSLNYSPMSLTRVFDEIAAADLGNVTREWRERVLHFEGERKAIWEKSLDRLRSPVQKRIKVALPQDTLPSIRAGESALSHYSMLTQPSHPIYAVSAEGWKDLQRSQGLTELTLHEPGSIELEIWRYAPGLFARQGVVDPLSLYLSLEDILDERIEMARDALLENFQW